MYSKVIGVMSGTSCDGLDLCLCSFEIQNNQYQYFIHKAITVDYPLELQNRLKNAISLTGFELAKLNMEWSNFVVNAINFNFNREEYDFVSSHGHTVFHQPNIGLTYQIGNLDILAANLQCDVIGDFRTMDVALGGQGAPLVPIGDEKLFNSYDCCLNLGGIANISYSKNGNRKALDVSPFNLIINQLVAKLGWLMDKDGNEAAKGKVNSELFNQLNNVEYYEIKGVKSLGKEYLDANFSFVYDLKIALQDKLCTFNHHVAYQINRLITPLAKNVLITGGGAYNKHFIQCLNQTNSKINWVVLNNDIVNYKEALIFGFLGYLRINNLINIDKSYTGAKRSSISGHWVKFN